MKIFTVAQMIAAEKEADAHGRTYAQMMEAAGQATAVAISQRYPIQDARILILVGPGNNGGDGLVCGRYLAQAGANVAFYLSHGRDPQQDPNYAQIQQMGLFVAEAPFDQRFRVLRTRLAITDILVDALLGTGVNRPIRADLAKLLQQVQAGLVERRAQLRQPSQPALHPIGQIEPTNTPFPVTVAVDCPSGLHCDSGQLDEAALPADLTVTFAGPKVGHFKFPGAAACGQLVVADIGIDPQLPAMQTAAMQLMGPEQARAWLPPRPLDGHKGRFGKLLLVAGSDAYHGAAILAAQAAFRAGAGTVTLASPSAVRQTAVVALPEASYLPIQAATAVNEQTAVELLPLLPNYRALLIGPGLGPTAVSFMQAICQTAHWPPLVVDADGLNGLAQLAHWPTLLPPQTVLTPHPAEMARLTGLSLNELLAADRWQLTQEQAQKWGHVVLLKGAYTVIAAPDGRVHLLPFANPALAVGGSGDVLAGVIAALLAQGVRPYEAAVLGGYLHGAAASLYPGKFGLLASELADLLPQAMQQLAD